MRTMYNTLHPSMNETESSQSTTEASLKKTKIVYGVLTSVLLLSVALAGFLDITRHELIMGVLDHLGYPAYLATILGVAKVLAVLAIVLPPCLEIKEWAYAGLAIDLLGATLSHLTVGDPAMEWGQPFGLLVLLGVSYALWKKIMIRRAEGAFRILHEKRL